MNRDQSTESLNLEVLSKHMPGVFLWKKDRNSVYMEANKACTDLFGFSNRNDVGGMTDAEIPCKISECAHLFQKQDMQVINTGMSLKILEIHPCIKDEWKIMLNTKNPLYDDKNNIYGTFAYCLDLTHSMGEIIRLLSKVEMGSYAPNKIKQNSYIFSDTPLDITLTKRQMDCLFYLLRGKSIREIAAILNKSPRTVENYHEQLKIKFSCQTKSELIELTMNKGYLNILPPHLLGPSLSKLI
ncbi:MAG: LuxR C-terminal-related transcriptional regulator [Legionellales bacterium]